MHDEDEDSSATVCAAVAMFSVQYPLLGLSDFF